MQVGGAIRMLADGPELIPVEEIDRIAALPDPFLRNLWITHSYGRLAAVMAAVMPGHANWCTFATWASKQAGQTIRGEDLLHVASRLLDPPAPVAGVIGTLGRRLLYKLLYGPDSTSTRLLRGLHDPVDVLRRMSAAVARGNLKVFAEIGRVFVQFLPLCREGPPMPEAVDAFCETLQAGAPPEGQDFLRSAFRHYAQALAAVDARARAQWMLLANLEIGFHEQTRLQPEIREALDVPAFKLGERGERLLRVLFSGAAAWNAAVRVPLAYLLGMLTAPVAWWMRRQLRLLATELLMVLHLPGIGWVHLGRDLSAPPAEHLRDVSEAELRTLLERLEPPAGQPDRSGAADWASLPERMHFILHLFRAYHDDTRLTAAPFTPAQVEALRAGRLPDGAL